MAVDLLESVVFIEQAALGAAIEVIEAVFHVSKMAVFANAQVFLSGKKCPAPRPVMAIDPNSQHGG